MMTFNKKIPAAPVPPDMLTAPTTKDVQKITYCSDDGARHRDPADVKLFSDDGQYTEKAIENIGKALEKIRTKNGWTNMQLLDHLDPGIYPSETTVSKIIHSDRKRSPSAAQLIELRRVFGVDLNALADGDNPFVLEEQSDICLANLLHQISEELLRRNCQE